MPYNLTLLKSTSVAPIKSSFLNPERLSSLRKALRMLSRASFQYVPLLTEEIRLLRRLPSGNYHSPAEGMPNFTPRSPATICKGLKQKPDNNFILERGISNTQSLLLGTEAEAKPTQDALETVSLNINPKFKALSYTWGVPNLTKEITMGGVTVPITENLFTALQRLRCEDVLWIDAICINQFDGVEKSVQVQKMRRIYEAAESVVISLGPEADDSHEVIECFEHINGIAKELVIVDLTRQQLMKVFKGANGELSRDVALKVEQHVEAVHHFLCNEFPVEAYYKFHDRSWWYRVWVIQEGSVAKEAVFVCG